jgi:hypothetical protein
MATFSALRDQPTDVAAGGVIGHATHRHRHLLLLVTRRQRQVEELRRLDGIIEEHLVEVTEPKKQDAVGIALFDL